MRTDLPRNSSLSLTWMIFIVLCLSFFQRIATLCWLRRFDRVLLVFIRRWCWLVVRGCKWQEGKCYCLVYFNPRWCRVGRFWSSFFMLQTVPSVVRTAMTVGISTSRIVSTVTMSWYLKRMGSFSLREYGWKCRSLNLIWSQSGFACSPD